jgi:hypothetical protein
MGSVSHNWKLLVGKRLARQDGKLTKRRGTTSEISLNHSFQFFSSKCDSYKFDKATSKPTSARKASKKWQTDPKKSCNAKYLEVQGQGGQGNEAQPLKREVKFRARS